MGARENYKLAVTNSKVRKAESQQSDESGSVIAGIVSRRLNTSASTNTSTT